MADDPETAPPICVWCHVPLTPMGSSQLPYWVCPECDEVSISV